jgi:hypothetical protein
MAMGFGTIWNRGFVQCQCSEIIHQAVKAVGELSTFSDF